MISQWCSPQAQPTAEGMISVALPPGHYPHCRGPGAQCRYPPDYQNDHGMEYRMSHAMSFNVKTR